MIMPMDDLDEWPPSVAQEVYGYLCDVLIAAYNVISSDPDMPSYQREAVVLNVAKELKGEDLLPEELKDLT